MKKVVTYKILPEFRIIIEFVYGQINYLDIMELKKAEIEHKDYNPNFNFIAVIQNAQISTTEDEISLYINTIKENSRIIGNRKSAILTSTPDQVVISTIYQLAAEMLPMNFKIFSTIDSALSWIEMPRQSGLKIKSIIENLIYNATHHIA